MDPLSASTTVTERSVASDNVAVAGVQFRVDGVNVGSEVTSAPYAVLWNTAGLPSGTPGTTSLVQVQTV